MTVKNPERKTFSVTVDAKRVKMLKELVEKVGIKQNGVVNMAITKLHEAEFAAKK
jgi:16S rRNA C967 or C1407 C5-methylase (RsmB/RsmF family)